MTTSISAVTIPDSLPLIRGEKLPLSIDCTGLIPVGDIISSPSAIVKSNTTNETVTAAINGSVTVASPVISLSVWGAQLRVGQKYTLVVSFISTGGSTTKPLSVTLPITVVY